MKLIHYIFISFLILFLFSGCSKHQDRLLIKADKKSLQKYIPNQEKKIESFINHTQYVALDGGSDFRELTRAATIIEIVSLINKIEAGLANRDSHLSKAEKTRIIKKAEYYFNRALQSDLVCHSKKDLQCNTSAKKFNCLMGKGVSSREMCSAKIYNTKVKDADREVLSAYKWKCSSHSEKFPKNHISPCETIYYRYMYLFSAMRNLYATVYDFENERKVINMYEDFLRKYQDRFPQTDNIEFVRKYSKYLFEYGAALQLTNRDLLLAKEKVQELDKVFLPTLESIKNSKGTEAYNARIMLLSNILNSRESVVANLHYYIKPTEEELVKEVKTINKHGQALGYNYYSAHQKYALIALRHGYINLAEKLMDSSPELTERVGFINVAAYNQSKSINEKRWEDALVHSQTLDKVHKKYNVLYKSEANRLRSYATVFEHLDRYSDAVLYAKKSISVVETDRKASQKKLNFFTSLNTKTYKTLIRSRYGLYNQNKSLKIFSALLEDIEKLRARSLKEKQNISAVLDVKKIQKRLKQDELIIGYVDLDEYFLVYTISSLRFNALKIEDINQTKKLVTTLKLSLANPSSNLQDLQDNLQELSKLVIEPIKKDLLNKKKLYLLTDSVLNFIPFDLLSSDSSHYKPLLESSSILLQPYISSVKKRSKVQVKKSFLALANPKFGKYRVLDMDVEDFENSEDNQFYFSSLPETYDEVKQISLYFPKNKIKIITGKNADLKGLKRINLSSYGYLHFATHGILGYELPGITEPSLVLANNTFLSSSDVRKLHLNARLTVLSACNTGSGKYSTGEGVMGIGQAFLSSGSQNVVMSLWQVPSKETVTLMSIFYKNINKGKSVDESLRLAKLSLIKSARKIKISNSRGLKRQHSMQYSSSLHPFYWAAFVIIGGGD